MRAHGKGKDTYEAAQAVKEQLTATPEVKAVVYQPVRYSGHKASSAQRDGVWRLSLPASQLVLSQGNYLHKPFDSAGLVFVGPCRARIAT